MNPFVDEKFVLTATTAFMELVDNQMGIGTFREAHGPNMNEGLCHEFCADIQFSGELNGKIYLAMDAYTKVLILPYIVDSFGVDPLQIEMVENVMISFVENFSNLLTEELGESIKNVNFGEIQLLSHKMVSLPLDEFRKYTVIFFLRHLKEKKYLGRIYLYVAFNKSENRHQD